MGANVQHLLAAATGVMIASLSCSRMPNNPVIRAHDSVRGPARQTATFSGLPISACSISGKVWQANQPPGPACEMLRRTNSIVAGPGKLLNPSRLRPNLVISASNSDALFGIRKQRPGQSKKST